LEPRAEDLDSKRDPSVIARRQQHANFSSTVKMLFRDTDRPSDAGLVAIQNETHSFFWEFACLHMASEEFFLNGEMIMSVKLQT
jgi:beta-xylosidase